ncbi:hypothetical protein, partial [Pedobacter sp. ASV12]|uniref:hypothetical protein n=1 Tax=Pedobacter sp. ASV12 TaxID=2795120 RepID=UPI0018EB96DD
MCIRDSLQAGDADITACLNHVANIAVANNIVLGNDGWPEKNGNSVTASQGIAILASDPAVSQNIENLSAKMLVHNIWIWKKGTIENHLNLQGKTEAIWANFCSTLEQSTLQIMLPNDHQEVESCIQWLMN